MACPSNLCLDWSLGRDTDEPREDNIWRLSFLSFNGLLTVGDSVMRDNTIATVVARNLLTPRDKRNFQRGLMNRLFKIL